jgi:hypothetical protein
MPPRDGPIAQQRARNARLIAKAERIAARDAVRQSELGGASGHPLPVILLPANTRDTELLPASSAEQFLQRLRTAIDVAFAQPLRDNSAPMSLEAAAARDDALEHPPATVEAPGAPELSALLGASCATCRGECCTAGGTHAFLREDSLTRVRAQCAADGAPVTADALEALYASHLPARHYRGSCVFHTTAACALPRGLRSNLCNRYLCGGLTQLSRALATTTQQAAYVAAADSVHLRRMAHLGPTGARPISLRDDDDLS